MGSKCPCLFGGLESGVKEGNGRTARQVLMGNSPVKSVTPLYEGKSVLKLGIFEKIPEPGWEAFAASRREWEKPLDGAVQYKTKSLGEKLQ